MSCYRTLFRFGLKCGLFYAPLCCFARFLHLLLTSILQLRWFYCPRNKFINILHDAFLAMSFTSDFKLSIVVTDASSLLTLFYSGGDDVYFRTSVGGWFQWGIHAAPLKHQHVPSLPNFRIKTGKLFAQFASALIGLTFKTEHCLAWYVCTLICSNADMPPVESCNW